MRKVLTRSSEETTQPSKVASWSASLYIWAHGTTKKVKGNKDQDSSDYGTKGGGEEEVEDPDYGFFLGTPISLTYLDIKLVNQAIH